MNTVPLMLVVAEPGHCVCCWQRLAQTTQEPAPSQAFPPASEQENPAVTKPSAGQVIDVPVHFSVASHASAAPRQTVLDERKPSTGQPAAWPVHDSAASHAPPEGRHTALEESNTSPGQAKELPVQRSSASQSPAAARPPPGGG